MAQLIPVDHDPFEGIDDSRSPFGAMAPSEIPQGTLQGQVLKHLSTDAVSSPFQAVQKFMDTGSPESAFGVATNLAGIGGPFSEVGAVGSAGGRLANFTAGESLRRSVGDMAEEVWQSNNGKLKKALEETGRMRMFAERVGYTPDEISQIEAMVREKSMQPFVSQAAKDRAAEAAADAAEKYIGAPQPSTVRSQGVPELIPVDHDPFSEGNPASAGQEAVSRLSNYKTEMEPGGQYVNLILPGGKSVGDYVPSHNELLRRAGVQGFDTIEDLGREMGLIRQHGNNNFELFGKAPDQSQLRQMMRTAKDSGDSSIFLDVWGPTGQLNSREFEFRETSHIPKWISEIAGREK